MADLFSFLITFAWQSTIVLGVAGGASILLRRRPALAHLAVTAGVIGTIVCAAVSQAVHRTGAGVLLSPVVAHTAAAPPVWLDGTAPMRVTPVVQSPSNEPPAATAATAAVPPDEPDITHAESPFPGMMILFGTWIVTSLLLIALSSNRAWREWRLVRRTRSIDDAAVIALATEVAETLGTSCPDLRETPPGIGPALWGWTRRPIVMLCDELLISSTDAERRGVIAHELAHYHRLDHATHLLASLMVMALPWHPLAWWCRRRLTTTSEEACDAWVLALGSNPRSYAGILLRLASQRGARFALSAIGTRRRMHRRIEQVLTVHVSHDGHPHLTAARVSRVIAATLAVAVAVSFAQPGGDLPGETTPSMTESGGPAQVVTEWVRRAGIPLAAIDPDPDDLARFGRLVGDARVVAMGMSAQGSRELFEHRFMLLRYLVEKKGFTTLVLGTSLPGCLALDDFVVEGIGDAEAALHAQGYWTYDTHTVLDTLHWLRRWNDDRRGRTAHFYGMDMQQAGPALDVAVDALRPFAADEVDDLARGLEPLRELYVIIDSYDDFDQLERDLLTEAADRLRALFDVHQSAIVASTSHRAWTNARRNAVVVVQFERWLRAHYAWLPPVGRRVFFDLWGRTETGLPGLITFLEACDTEYAAGVHDRLRTLADDPYWTGRSFAADRVNRMLGTRIGSRLDTLREAYEKQTSPERWQAAREMAETLDVWQKVCGTLPEATLDAPGIERDKAMADNVAWILEQAAPDGKVLIWGHNGGIGRSHPAAAGVTLGDTLAERFGNDYRPIAFTFGRGSILAIHNPIEWDPAFVQRLGNHVLDGPSPVQVERVLLEAGMPSLALDLTTDAPAAVRSWLDRPRPMWSIGPGYGRDREMRGDYVTEVILSEAFDGLVFLETTSPSLANRRTRERFEMEADSGVER